MKKIYPVLNFVLVLMIGLSGTSCNKLAEGIEFDFNLDGTFPIPKGTPANTPFDLPALPVSHDLEKTFEQQGTSADLIKEIKLKALQLSIEEPAGGDFSFLKEIEIIFFKEGVGEKLVAWKYNINVPGEILNLDVTPDPLDDYLKKGDFEMRVKVALSSITTQDYKVKYDMQGSVKADLFQ